MALAAVAEMPAQSTPTQPAPAADPDIIELSAFTISAEKPNQYRAMDSSSASRIRTSIKDTAASISVLTPELLQDIAPARAFEATRYVAGISEGRGDGFGDRQIIRGFENLNRTVDNFASVQGENADSLMIDRVEVLKGPSAIIAPTGAPGGVVSVVSKVPRWKDYRSITATLGMIDAQRIDVDVSGPIPIGDGKTLAYRALAAYQNGRLAVDGTKDKRKIVGGSVTYRISPSTQLTLRASYEDRWIFVYLPVFIDSSAINGANATLARGFNYGNDRNGTETWAHRGGQYGAADMLLTTALNEHISSRLAVKYQYDLQRDQYMAAVTPSLGNRYNPYTGQETPDQTWALNSVTGQYVATNSPLFDITAIQRRPYLVEGHTSSIAFQYDLAAKYKFDVIDTTSVAGVAYTDQKSFARTTIGPDLMFNLLAPVYGAEPVFNTLSAKSSAAAKTWQLYLNELFGFFDNRLLVTGGLVRVSTNQDNLNQVSNIGTALDDSKNLALVGALYKVTNAISVYGSRSVNAVPTIANNKPLWQEGQQFEFGVKFSAFNDRLSFTAARFQISQTNVTVPNPAYQADTTQPQSIISDLKATGYEFEVMGGITKELSVIASSTFLHERDSLGRPVRAIADRNAALLLNYKFSDGTLKGLSAFVGTTYAGRRSGEATAINFTQLGVVAQPSFFLAPVTLLNLGARYTWDKVSFSLNVDNALNKEYIGIPTARTNAGLGLPRNVRLTTTFLF